MATTQYMSASALRALKSSRYMNGNPQKMMLEAKRASRATSQFMSKSGAKAAAKKMKLLKNTTKQSKSLWDIFLKKTPGGNPAQKAGKLGGAMPQLLILAGLTLAQILTTLRINSLQDLSDMITTRLGLDISKALSAVSLVQGRVEKLNKRLDINNKDVDRINLQTGELIKSNEKNKEFQNNITYEVRQGRKIVEGQIETARKLANDALYEARQGRQKVEAQINEIKINFADQAAKLNVRFNEINARVASFLGGVKDNSQQAINTTIANLKASLDSANKSINNQNTTITKLSSDIGSLSQKLANVSPGNTNITEIVKANVRAETASLEKKFIEFGSDIARLKIQDNLLTNADTNLASSISNVGYNLKIVDGKVEALSMRSSGGGSLTLSPAQLQQINEKIQQGDTTNKAAIDQLTGQIQQIKNTPPPTVDLSGVKTQISNIDGRLRTQEKVNLEALPKLDDITNKLGFIPALTANAIRPDIPTLPQIENATGTAMCRSMNGGCSGRKLDQQSADIKDAISKGDKGILDKLNAGLNGAELGLLNTINSKLGAQLPGGLSAAATNTINLVNTLTENLGKLAKWLHLDRILNIMTLAATIHNAAMLSNDLGQTLLSAISNALAVIGLKDKDDNPYNFGNIIGNTIEAIVRGVVGDENYVVLNANWQKAVRVYQATANIISSITNIGNTIINALEVVGGWVAKIGNGLKFWGVLGENAYNFMNPQPNFNSKIFTWLENAQQGASVLQQVTQAPLDVAQQITELNRQREELTKDIKEDAQSSPGYNPPAAEKTTEDAAKAKDLSKATLFNVLDIFNANE